MAQCCIFHKTQTLELKGTKWQWFWYTKRVARFLNKRGMDLGQISVAFCVEKMPRLSQIQRERAIGLLQAGQLSADVARRFRVHITTIRRLRQRLQDTGTTADRRRSGRPRVTTPNQDRNIRLRHLRNRFLPATQTAAEIRGRNNRRITGQTIRNRLREDGLHARRPLNAPAMTDRHRRNRLNWCRERQAWTRAMWRRILWSDESRFQCFRADGRQRVWRRRGERYAEAAVRPRVAYGGPSVMVWGGITFQGRTELYVIQNNLNARRYCDEILAPIVVPFLTRQRQRVTFQQDNARPHTARVSMGFLQQNNVDVLPWPAMSPDLNPIEHVWDELGRRVTRRQAPPTTRAQLVQALHEEWAAIPQAVIQRLVNSMQDRVTACIRARGGVTRY